MSWLPAHLVEQAVAKMQGITPVVPRTGMALFQVKNIASFSSEEVLRWSRFLGRCDNLMEALVDVDARTGQDQERLKAWIGVVQASTKPTPKWMFWRNRNVDLTVLKKEGQELLGGLRQDVSQVSECVEVVELLRQAVSAAQSDASALQTAHPEEDFNGLLVHLAIVSQTLNIVASKLSALSQTLSRHEKTVLVFTSATSSLLHTEPLAP